MMRALRMTVAALHRRMTTRFTRLGRRIDARFRKVDTRFTESDARMRAGFESIHDRLKSLSRQIAEKHDHYDRVNLLHERRLQDLERQSPPQAGLGASEREP